MGVSQELIKGTVVPVVLALLKDRPRYGYEMVQLVNARTNGALDWSEGTRRGMPVDRLPLAGLLPRLSAPRRDAAIAALNGLLGDRLEQLGHPLALPMQLRHAGRRDARCLWL